MADKRKVTGNKMDRLKDPLIRKWHKSMKGQTADINLRRLFKFCGHDFCDYPEGIVPGDLLSLKDIESDHQKIFELIVESISDFETEGYAPQYISGILKAVKSFLRFNAIFIQRRAPISKIHSTPSLEMETIPDTKTVRKLLRCDAPLMHRVCASFIAFSGIRPEVLGTHNSQRGLELRDIPDMKIEGKKVIFDTTPAIIHVRIDLDKNERGYHTFFPSEGCDLLKEYLEARLEKGEVMTPTTPVRQPRGHRTTKAIRKGVRDALRSVGVYERPYVLRRYFETVLSEHPRDIRTMTRDYIGGHAPTMSNSYVVGKGNYSPVLEGMREEYASIQNFLQDETIESYRSIAEESKLLKEKIAELETRERRQNEHNRTLEQNIRHQKDVKRETDNRFNDIDRKNNKIEKALCSLLSHKSIEDKGKKYENMEDILSDFLETQDMGGDIEDVVDPKYIEYGD